VSIRSTQQSNNTTSARQGSAKMLGYRLGSLVACFGDEISPRHLKGADFAKKRRKHRKKSSKCINESWIFFDSLSIELKSFSE
jgi:hypothetical protein